MEPNPPPIDPAAVVAELGEYLDALATAHGELQDRAAELPREVRGALDRATTAARKLRGRLPAIHDAVASRSVPTDTSRG